MFTKLLHAGCEDIPIQYSTLWNKQEGAASVGRRCRLRGSKVPPPWVEGAAFERRRYGLQGFWCALYIVFQGKKREGESFCSVFPK